MPNINDYGLPFTSQDGDRKYSALEWREYFSRLIHNGLIQNAANECQVNPQAAPNKTVYVDTGVVFINGAMRVLEEPVTLAVAENTSGNPRIDRVVARLNEASRTIEFDVLEGTPAGSPVAPALTRAAGVYELGLADITLANGYSTITSGVINDKRWDVSLCGASSMTIGVIPPSGLEAETVTLSTEAAALYGAGNVDASLIEIGGSVFKAKSFLSGGSWGVPAGVTKIKVFACASGAGVNAGEYILGEELTVTPNQTVNITVGSGNTIINGAGISKTLIAGGCTTSVKNDIFGIALGIDGTKGNGSFGGVAGKGGAFGCGGGGGAQSAQSTGGGPGASPMNLPATPAPVNTIGVNGIDGKKYTPFSALSKLLPNIGTASGSGGNHGNATTKAGNGGNGGGGALGGAGATPREFCGGGGGGAGGYGAGGGGGASSYGGVDGQPTPGFVLILW